MELRWVLLGFGAVVILAVYLWGKGVFRSAERSHEVRRRDEPRFDKDAPETEGEEPVDFPEVSIDQERPKATAHKATMRTPEKVVALRLIPREESPTGERTVLALRKVGLEHGRLGIFHRIADQDAANPLFSVANLTSPGSFNLSDLANTQIPGLSIFMVLPGAGDPVERFDAMLETARSLAHELDVELFDEKGSSWSVQRERFLREEMIQYRHRLEHG